MSSAVITHKPELRKEDSINAIISREERISKPEKHLWSQPQKEDSINATISREERILKLKKQFWSQPHTIDSERMRLVTEAYQKFEGQEIHIKRANVFKYILENMTIYIQPHELIGGNVGRFPRAGMLMPENNVYWIEENLDLFEKREQDKYVCTEETKAEVRKYVPYWKGRCKKDMLDCYIPEEAEIAVEAEFTFASLGLNYGLGHGNISYGKVLNQGLSGIKQEAEEKLREIDLGINPDDYEKYCFYKAVLISLEGVINFARRYADLAKGMAEQERDPERKWELEQIAENCSWAPENPARNFWEAVQAFHITQCALWIEQDGFSYSPGRFDQYMYPFYARDEEKGIMTYSKALELVDCAFIKLSEIVQLLDSYAAPFWAGDPTGQDLCVGGVDREGKDATNTMSFICLDALAEVRLIQPNFAMRYHKDTPWDLRLKAAEVIKLGGGMPQNFNDEVMIASLVRRGYSLEDARNWCIIGCVEVVTAEDNWGNGGAAWNSIPKLLSYALNNGVARFGKSKGKQMGPQTGDPRNFKSYEEVWNAFETQMKYFVKQGAIVTNMYDFIHGELTPQPFYSVCSLNPMETGIDATRGGTRYNVLCPQAVGVVDVGDSLVAIKKLVFEEKIITMAELIDALDTNFAGKEDFRQLLINRAPKYGNDDPYVDEIVAKVSELWCREVEQYTIPRRHGRQPERVRTEEEKRMVRELEKKYGKCDIDDGHHSPGIYTVISNVPFGKMCEALPSGRLAGTPLTDGGISPEVGRDQLGPTAVFKSAAKIKHVLASNGTLLNQRFTPRTLQGEDGTRNLASLIKSYHDMGGNHVQFNVVSSKTLREAQRKPNDYQGLMVRVAGYSAFFNALMPETQDNIIHRVEQGEGR